MKPMPPSHQEAPLPKGIAVFLCGCEGSIGKVLSLPSLMEMVHQNQSVKEVEVLDNCCSSEGLERMRLSLRSGLVDRFLVVGCSSRREGERFRRLALDSGIDPYLVDMCNVREQCILVHPASQVQAKAERMLRTSLARLSQIIAPPHRLMAITDRTIMVLGNGHSAVAAAREAISLGHNVILVNHLDELRDNTLGEEMINLDEATLDIFLKEAGSTLTLVNGSLPTVLRGRPGEFVVTLDTPLGETDLGCGSIIVAYDEEERSNPLRDRYGPDTMLQSDLQEMLRSGGRPGQDIIMLALDEDGESAFDPMSTHEAVHNALYLKGVSPRSRVTIITREVFALGQCEVGYRKAMELGVRFIRTDRLPLKDEGHLIVHDLHLGEGVRLPFHVLVLDDHLAVPDLRKPAKVLGLPVDVDGRLVRPNAKLKPAQSLRSGVFLCGTAMQRNSGIGPSLEARAAVALASESLCADHIWGGEVAEVFEEKCSACLSCVRICPYGAPSIGKEGKAGIEIGRCVGCGMCLAACPSKAIQIFSYQDRVIEAQVQAAVREAKG